MKKKLAFLAAAFGGATVFNGGGCLSLDGFWQGLWGRGWPTDNLWMNIGWDVLQEELFG